MGRFLGVLFILSLALLSCSEDKGSPKPPPKVVVGENPFPPDYEKADSSGEFSTTKMLLNIGVNIQRENAQKFLQESRELETALANTCGGEAPVDFQKNWQESAQRWRRAMLAFHRLEIVPMGPLIENKSELQTQIYAWPFINACGIDLEVEARSRGAARPASSYAINIRGLGAIEYLLYEPELKSSCNGRAYPQMKVWNTKPTEQKALERCHLALDLAHELVVQANTLDRGWDTQKGNYSYTLTNGSKYKKMDDAVTEYVHGLFAIEHLKDQRLARPLGLHKLCTSDEKKCPEYAEHNLSGLGIEAIEVQIQAFQEGFFGSVESEARAFGLDDYLVAAGHPEAVSQMQSALQKVLTNIEQVRSQGSLEEQIRQMSAEDCQVSTSVDRRVPLCALYQDIREISNLLKTDILVFLSLRAPPGVQGDND